MLQEQDRQGCLSKSFLSSLEMKVVSTLSRSSIVTSLIYQTIRYLPWTLIKELSLSWLAPSLHLDPISNTCNPHSSNDTFLLGPLGCNLYIITTQHHFSARMHCPAHDIYSQERILLAGCIDSIIILYKTFLLLKAVIRLSSELFPRISSLTLVPDR